MKKTIIWIISGLFFITLLFILTYEKVNSYTDYTKVEIDNNPFNFNTISNKDSITHIFKIKNITNTLLVIEKVLPSCPCTKVKFDKKRCVKDEIVTITVKYKPTLKQKGNVKTIVFVQCNAEKGILKLEMKGKIKNN